MSKIILFFNLMLCCLTIQAQVDTNALKQIVPTDYDLFKQKQFWNYIYIRDQDRRNSPRIENMDEENLILVSYYFNRFGYPDYLRLGQKVNIINMVWVHNRYAEINKICAPIIIAGFQQNAILEKTYRDYYLRALYQTKFDDHGYKSKTLDSIYNDLDIHPATKIPIEEIVKKFGEYQVLKSDTALLIGTWLTPSFSDTNEFHGKLMIAKTASQRVSIFQSSNQKIYLKYFNSDNSLEPRELERCQQNKNKFIEKNITSERSYEINKEGNLIYNNPKGSIRLEYIKIR